MSAQNRNIYQAARKSAGLTQEAAAERLDISVESIRAYETNQRIPPNDVVEGMVVVYNGTYLAYQHLHETNALAARFVPELRERSVIEAVVRIGNSLNKFSKAHNIDRLYEIAEDNRIDSTERAEFDAILDDVGELVKRLMELEVFSKEGKEG